MSSGRRRKVGPCLVDRVLVSVAKRLGPQLDRLDVDANVERIKVRDLVMEFTTDNTSPTEVRVAVLDLVDRGDVVLWGSAMSPDGLVGLELHGLLAARKIEHGVGRPVSAVTLTMLRGRKAGLFSAKMETGNEKRDAGLNRSGLSLAALYVVGAVKPTKDSPLMLSACRPYFTRLACLGVGPKSGPDSRIVPALDSITKAMETLSPALVTKLAHAEDGRESGWFLRDGFPEVRVVGASGPQYRDWCWMQFNLGLAIKGKPFIDKLQNVVKPLTDEQVRVLEEESDAGKKRKKPMEPPRQPQGAACEPTFPTEAREKAPGGWGAIASPA